MSEHPQRLEVGAYLLGGLEPRERAAFETHLAGCDVCREEVADLAGLPALLGRLSADEVLAPLPPMPARPVAARRRGSIRRPAARRRLLLAAAAAVVVALVVGMLALTGVLGGAGGSGPPVAARAALTAPGGPGGPGGRPDGPSGTADLTATRQGSVVAVRVWGIPAGQRCALVL
ncbi:MAG TPA: zf-HC2 domain-containing protein, partial [Frankiaceae bacterium]|nr:zf-HC2 domain-containing protein [Frankiaceae bacterium]